MGHVDPKQPPQRSKPWTAIAALDFIHKVELIAPLECYPTLREKLVEQRQRPVYTRVVMPLGQLLEADFLSRNVKNGNITMLSQGRADTDNVFSLHKGLLNLHLDKETFERAGLAGKPFGAKGNRGLKPRWIVSYDLRDPSMTHGKKGFNRLLYACQHVFDKPVTWLLCSAGPNSPDLECLGGHAPTSITIEPATATMQQLSHVTLTLPACIRADGDRQALEETATELYEWLSLVRLQSPRIAAGDSVDPFLSRYCAPPGNGGQTQVLLLGWQGLIAASWLRDLITEALAACTPQHWISISATCFPRGVSGNADGITLLRPPGAPGEYLLWETKCSDR
ncbi:hypothetical protein CDD83_9099 [Cordyceps sp. RAO-2017]|nr:hypothetical protein CDD83_9099 [Cordyceps sp. RAO-2017]